MTSNQDAITLFLQGKGLTPAQVAGVEGNLKVESGFSPTAYNAGERAIGIAQWEGPRRTALQAYARAHGSTETNLTTQLGFLWHELTGSESSSLKALRATSTPAAAAAAFDKNYERSSGQARGQRESAATVIARTLSGSTGVGGLAPADTSSDSSPSSTSTTTTGGASIQPAGFLSKVTGVDYVLKGTRNLVLEATAVALAAALVGGGVYRLFGPQIKAAAGSAKSAATKGAMVAATGGAGAGAAAAL